MSQDKEKIVDSADADAKMYNEDFRRTRAKAESNYKLLGGLGRVPFGTFSVISHKNYRKTFDWSPNQVGYLQHLRDGIDINFRNGIMYVGDKPASEMDTVDLFTGEHVDIDISFLEAMFSIILENLTDRIKKIVPELPTEEEFKSILDQKKFLDFLQKYFESLQGFSVNIYIPDIMRYVGYKKYNAVHEEELKNKIKNLSRVIGKTRYQIYGVSFSRELELLPWNYDENNNVLTLQSPYINHMIYAMWKDTHYTAIEQVRRNITCSRDVSLPFVHTLMKPEIVRARNKRAVEIVARLCLLIIDTGQKKNKTPHIGVRTLIDDCPDLYSAFELTFTRSERNRLLNRTFTAVWDYIKVYTYIGESFTYETFIPKDDYCDMEYVIEFHRIKRLGEKNDK